MAVTQKEIAARVGVSQQLVAFALNGKGRMSDEIRQRIEEEAQRAGYRPNRAARALLTSRTNLIAVWVPRIETDLCARVLSTCESIIRQSGFEMIVVSGIAGDRLGEGDESKPTWRMKWPTDGILMFDPPVEVRDLLANKGMPPAVLMGPYAIMNGLRGIDGVGVDLEGAARQAMAHLIGQGCRRILHITTPLLLAEEETRSSVYFGAMAAAGLETEVLPVVHSSSHRTMTQRALEKYVAANGWPDALFCSNDDGALGAMRVVRAAKLAVPEQVKIIACDGIEDAEDAFIPLSTIVQPIEQMCRRAWEMLEHRVSNPDEAQQRHVFQAELLLRDSAG